MFPISYESIVNCLDTGFCYVGKRDRDHRPTIVIDCAKIVKFLDIYSEDMICQCVAYTIAYAIDNLLIEGKVETLNLLFDAGDVGISEVPASLLRNVSKICLDAFPTRINRTFVVGLSFFMKSVYWMMYYFIPEFTRNVLSVVSEDELKEVIGKWYDLKNMPKKYGGTLVTP